MADDASPDAAANLAAHVLVRGRVQGVGFRAWVRRTARRLGLAGWVRNRPDGSVEAVFAGSGEAVAEMRWAIARGPASSRVDEVIDIAAEAAGLPPDFEVRPTG